MSTPDPSAPTTGVVMYSTAYCGYCVRAERLLADKGIPFERIAVDGDEKARRWLVELTGRFTVPQILIHGRPIGGFTELASLARTGRLDELLASPAAE